MKINKVAFEEHETSQIGLKAIKLERLGSVVALVGKNGSGKTRILNFIENNFESVSKITDFLKGNLSFPPDSIAKELYELKYYKELILIKERFEQVNLLFQNDRSNETLRTERQQLKTKMFELEKTLSTTQLIIGSNSINLAQRQATPTEKINNISESINSNILNLKSNYIKRVNYSEIRQLQEIKIENEDDVTSFEKLVESVSDQLVYNELGSIYKSSLRFLRKLPHKLAYDMIDCLGDSKKFEKRDSFKRYTALKEIFDGFFGKTLEWEMKTAKKNVTDDGVQSTQAGFWKINGREFNYAEFSDGEKTIFAYVLLFFLMSQNKKIRLKESIIIIDEPELHLHPDAEIDLINGIRNIIAEKGQLWIATHSINILSHLNFDEIFMVKDGQINHPSQTIQSEALSELMQIEERVLKLSEFITNISEWTYINFMVECFTNPDVIEIAKDNDPQVKSVKEIINLNSNGHNTLLLDFGAGKGRLVEQVMLDEKLKGIVECSALEPNTDFHKILSDKGVKKIYSSYEELTQNCYDYIVLCNVLHEINIDEWVHTINKVISSLKSNGHLIIIEAKYLNKGEQIGSTGFLLLDENEIQVLFNLSDCPSTLKHKELMDNITCVLIPRKDLNTISNLNLNQTIDVLEKNTLHKIEEIRLNQNYNIPKTKFGRQSAFLAQQYINVKLTKKHLANLGN